MKWSLNATGILQHISLAERGLQCGSVCVLCREPLIAKKGDVRKHHFAHASGRSDCPIEPESILHKFGKQVISDALRLKAPPEEVFGDYRELAFTSVREEVRFEGMQPDLVGVTDQGAIFVEIAVTSVIDGLKIDAIAALGIPTLEINLSQFAHKDFDSAVVKDFILNGDQRKTWIVPMTTGESCQSLRAVEAAKPSSDFVEEKLNLHGMPAWFRMYPNGTGYLRSPYPNDSVISTIFHLRAKYQGKWVPDREWTKFPPHSSSLALRDLQLLSR